LDFVYVIATVFFIGLIAAWYPSRRLIGSSDALGGIKEE